MPGLDPMAAPDALQQPVELDLFEGPLDLLLTLVLRDEVDLELPLVEVVTAALGERPASAGTRPGRAS